MELSCLGFVRQPVYWQTFVSRRIFQGLYFVNPIVLSIIIDRSKKEKAVITQIRNIRLIVLFHTFNASTVSGSLISLRSFLVIKGEMPFDFDTRAYALAPLIAR